MPSQLVSGLCSAMGIVPGLASSLLCTPIPGCCPIPGCPVVLGSEPLCFAACDFTASMNGFSLLSPSSPTVATLMEYEPKNNCPSIFPIPPYKTALKACHAMMALLPFNTANFNQPTIKMQFKNIVAGAAVLLASAQTTLAL